VLAVVFAFTGDDAASGAAPRPASTPLWSVRRGPQAVVDGVGAQRLLRALDTELGGETTCFMVDGSGAHLASHNADTPLIGASTQKILVAAATLAVLGPDSHYETKAVAPSAPTADGAVERLFLVGGGDPVLATNEYRDYLQSQGKTSGTVTTSLEALADSVVAAGVRHVPGGVVADDSRYDEQRFVPTWKSSYRTDGDVGPLGALTVNDGFRQWTPRKITVDDPALNAANELSRLLTDRGVQVGAASRGVAPKDAADVATVQSAPLSAVVGSMLSASDNVSAELFTKELGVRVSQQGSTLAGTTAIKGKLRDLGVPVDNGLTLTDGSGLDRGNRVTCRILVATLGLGDQPGMRTLWDGLPVAGVNGTLFDELNDTKLAGTMRGKTGSLDGVSGLLGMVDLGRSVRFAFLDNGDFTEREAAPLRAKAANIIATYPDAPKSDELVPVPALPR
jgi:D-alanyl-D-alanine carboxypeptidase/D-alanyl-D-alanine-endopeptidase (penicillin-binding protein 4)